MMWLMFWTLFSFQSTIDSQADELVPFQDKFVEAVDKYESIERAASKPLFEDIAAQLEQVEDMSKPQREMYSESLKYLALLTYPDESEAFFEKLIQFDPSFQLDSQRFPPKIVGQFDDLRQRLVARIRVAIGDADQPGVLLTKDALVYVNGKLAGLLEEQDVFDVLAGEALVEVKKPNYSDFQIQTTLPANEVTNINGQMSRTAAELKIVTIPSNIDVFLQGVSQGTTRGTLPLHLADEIRAQGADPSKASEPLTINDVLPGRFELMFRGNCYKNNRYNIEVTTLREYFYLIRMVPTDATLSINAATQTSGIVYLDDQRLGSLPLQNHPVCPGTYTLRVQFTDGSFIRRLTIVDGDQQTITAKPLPSIAYFGIENPNGPKPPADVDGWLRGLNSWNVTEVDPNDTRRVPVNPFEALFNKSRQIGDLGDELRRHVRADLFVAARAVRRKVVINFLEVAFWTPHSQKIQVYAIDFRELGKLKTLLDNIDQIPSLAGSWLGIQVAKLQDIPGCRILEVDPNGPLADQVKVGEHILSINASPLTQPGQLSQIPLHGEVEIELEDRTITVQPHASIAEIPFDPEHLCPQAVLARIEKTAKYHPDALMRQSGKFNQARYLFYLGDYQKAYDLLSTMQLPDRPGINQGTLYYYQGLCFHQLKIPQEAKNAFQRVLNYPNATLFDAYGPRAAFWAEIQLLAPNP